MLDPLPRAEHIGSLKRPDVLLQKRAELTEGRCTAEDLRACEDECIAGIVRVQLGLDYPVITDGEFRRDIFYAGFYDKLLGLKDVCQPPAYMFQSFNFVQSWPLTHICTEKLRRQTPLYGEAFDYLKRVAGPENIGKLKVTLGAPEWYHFRHGKYTYEKTAYQNDAEYFADVARIYREEIQDLYSRGCRRIQIDDPVLSCFCDVQYRQRMEDAGVDPAQLLDMYLGVFNDCIRDKPDDMVAGIHICRGNVKSDGSQFTRGAYDYIAQKLLTRLNFDCFYLEYDSERAGSFDCLRHLPRNKRVVLGLVSSKVPTLEDPAALRGRIMQAAGVIAHGDVPRSKEEALDQLALSPQCGFASHSRGFELVTHEVMVKKLALVRDVARDVWGDS